MEEQAKFLDKYIEDSRANMADIREEHHELSTRMNSFEGNYLDLLECRKGKLVLQQETLLDNEIIPKDSKDIMENKKC